MEQVSAYRYKIQTGTEVEIEVTPVGVGLLVRAYLDGNVWPNSSGNNDIGVYRFPVGVPPPSMHAALLMCDFPPGADAKARYEMVVRERTAGAVTATFDNVPPVLVSGGTHQEIPFTFEVA